MDGNYMDMCTLFLRLVGPFLIVSRRLGFCFKCLVWVGVYESSNVYVGIDFIFDECIKWSFGLTRANALVICDRRCLLGAQRNGYRGLCARD